MSSLNKVILIGNLGADPEKRVTGGGQTVTHFNIATTERWNDKSGQRQEKTEWHRIVVWGQQAENCAQYLNKGSSVCVEGRQQTREWEKDGIKRYTTEINAQRVQFLGGRGNQAERGAQGTSTSAGDPFPSFEGGSASPDDVPF